MDVLPSGPPAGLAAVETPVPVVDMRIVERNLERMQAYCDRHGLALRPHVKTHKLPRLAARQTALGAVGITCQKPSEAEAFVAAGASDVLISYPCVGPAKAARLAGLARRTRLGVAADGPEAVDTAAEAARQAGAPIRLLVEFDSGLKRTGVGSVEDALALARRAEAAEGVVFDGLMTYPATAATAGFVAAARERFTLEGLAIPTVSGGGTPQAWTAHTIPGLTEYRVGTYAYNDRSTVLQGAAGIEDCALLVHATVVSRPSTDRAIIDAGSKTLSSDLSPEGADGGYGLVLDCPGARIERLSEEHGMLDLSRATYRPAVGTRVRVLPNHVCVVVNLHDAVLAVEDGQVLGERPVAARGLTR